MTIAAPARPRPEPRAGTTASTSRPATARPSAARSPPTPAACTCCATATPAARCSASRRCWPTGRVVRHLGGLEKDNTGYDLAGLLCGSEGTLGVVTAARLRLVPRTDERVVALLALRRRRRRGDRRRSGCGSDLPTLEAAELFLADGLDLVVRAARAAPPVRGRPRGVPAGRGGRRPPTRPTTWPTPSTVSTAWPTSRSPPTAPRRAELWRYREAHTEAINRSARRTSST